MDGLQFAAGPPGLTSTRLTTLAALLSEAALQDAAPPPLRLRAASAACALLDAAADATALAVIPPILPSNAPVCVFSEDAALPIRLALGRRSPPVLPLLLPLSTLRALGESIAHGACIPVGGGAPPLYVPSEVWAQRGVKIVGFVTKRRVVEKLVGQLASCEGALRAATSSTSAVAAWDTLGTALDSHTKTLSSLLRLVAKETDRARTDEAAVSSRALLATASFGSSSGSLLVTAAASAVTNPSSTDGLPPLAFTRQVSDGSVVSAGDNNEEEGEEEEGEEMSAEGTLLTPAPTSPLSSPPWTPSTREALNTFSLPPLAEGREEAVPHTDGPPAPAPVFPTPPSLTPTELVPARPSTPSTPRLEPAAAPPPPAASTPTTRVEKHRSAFGLIRSFAKGVTKRVTTTPLALSSAVLPDAEVTVPSRVLGTYVSGLRALGRGAGSLEGWVQAGLLGLAASEGGEDGEGAAQLTALLSTAESWVVPAALAVGSNDVAASAALLRDPTVAAAATRTLGKLGASVVPVLLGTDALPLALRYLRKSTEALRRAEGEVGTGE